MRHEQELFRQITRDGFITKHGLIYQVVPVPPADVIAKKYGFVYAEQMVRFMEEEALK